MKIKAAVRHEMGLVRPLRRVLAHHAHAVDAVAQAGELGPVLEDVAQVRVAASAHHLGEVIVIAEVGPGLDGLFRDGSPKAGPSGAGVEFGLAVEQRRPAADAMIDARDLGVVLGV